MNYNRNFFFSVQNKVPNLGGHQMTLQLLSLLLSAFVSSSRCNKEDSRFRSKHVTVNRKHKKSAFSAHGAKSQ